MTIDEVIDKAKNDGWKVREGETLLSVGPRRHARFTLSEEIIDWIGGQVYHGKAGVPHSISEIVAINSDAETLWALLVGLRDSMDMHPKKGEA